MLPDVQVAEDFPIKQGLKPYYFNLSNVWLFICCRRLSNKTRIETCLIIFLCLNPSICCRRLSNKTRIETHFNHLQSLFGRFVAEDFPIKQGLKRICTFQAFTFIFVAEDFPIKQGLKPTSY